MSENKEEPYHGSRDFGSAHSSNRYGGGGTMAKTASFTNSSYADDMRISKILRRLAMETNPIAAIELCKHLEVAVRSPTNSSYICRSFGTLLEGIIAVLRQSPPQCLNEVSFVLGLVGYMNHSAFLDYKSVLAKAYRSFPAIRKYIAMALRVTFSYDAVNLELLAYSDDLIVMLKDYLENVDSESELFVALTETIVEFSRNYKYSFEHNFTDIVDIVVGWHLEAEQPLSIKIHCSAVLQQLSPYFYGEYNFTIDLMGQFLEDILPLNDELMSLGAGKDTKVLAQKMATFIGAFNTILKALYTKIEYADLTGCEPLLKAMYDVVMKCPELVMAQGYLNVETVLNINDFICLLLMNNTFAHLADVAQLEHIVRLQCSNMRKFSDEQQLSLLYTVLVIVREFRTAIPCSMVALLFRPQDNHLRDALWKRDSRQYKLLLKIYHSVLMLKNVPLLQEAYKHIRADIADIMGRLEVGTGSMTRDSVAFTFHLTALASLAMQTSSIIGMYALYPSILELLVTNCQAANIPLWGKYPTLHRALLQVVITHATKNHYFLSTSRLFSDQEANSSRTADNYSLILKFVADIMSAAEQLNENLLKLLLAFLRELFDESRPYATLLRDNSQFLGICRRLPRAGSRTPHECGATVEVLLDFACLHTEALRSLRDMVMQQFEASDKAVRELYMRLFAKLPLDITLMHLKEVNSEAAEASKTYELEQWYRANMKCSIRDKHFKTFLDALNVARSKESAAPPSLPALCHSSFLQSWSVQLSAKAMDYQSKAYANSAVRELWMQYEAARYCVRNKLRTIIGKPQETFLAIEAIIGMYARIILATGDNRPKLGEYAEIRSNSQMLLGFYESLEKLVYNASEGTAFALSPLEKAASTFFRINAHTCHEWFKRIRNSVNVVAQFSSQFDMVTRLSETVLKETPAASDTSLMDQNIITLAWALINTQEDDTLMGLHVWCKGKFGRRYTWLQHTADQVAGRKEKAFEGYWSHLKENDSELSDKLKDFILDQMLECLYFTGQWAKMAEACSRLPVGQCNLLNARPATQLNVLQEHMAGIAASDLNSPMNAALLEFSDWSHIGRVKDSPVTSNFTRDMVRQQESDFVNSMIQQEGGGGGTKLHDIITQEIQEWMRADRGRKSLDSFADYIILNCLSQQQEQVAGLLKNSCVLGFTDEESRVPCTVLTKCLFWQVLTERYSQMPTKATPRLYLDVASNARLEGNANYCRMMLERFFAAKGYEGAIGQIADKLQQQQQDDAAWFSEDSEILRGYGELTKYTFNKSPAVAIEMASDLCLKIVRSGSGKEVAPVHEIGANMLLTIADWLGQRGHSHTTIGEPSSKLHALIEELPEQERVSRADHVMIPQVERAIGCLISGSIYERETSAEAWCAYGNWCYRWGKKIMESKNSEGATPHSTLTQRDLALIREVCGNDIGEAQLRQLVDILNSHQLRVYDDCLDDIDAADTNSTELIELEVRKIETFASMPVDKIANIIRIWRKAYKNLYTHYEMATEAYFRYLALENSDAVAANGGTGGPECGIDSEGDIEDSSLVTVTLRLLRLIAKHAIGLQDVLEEGLKTTPLRPWRIIIPQLFSRLNHHEPYVRKSVSELLCRLAKAKPDLIIFPVIVGAEQELKAGQKQQTLAANAQQTSLSTCFHSLLTALSSQAPESVLHVRLLIKELKRISLLWEEYWLHSLVKLYNEYSTHFVALDAELKKCPATATEALRSVKEKYELTMSHLSADFEMICQTTEKPPETTYERCFQERFGPVIRSTLDQLRRPLDLSKPNENWLSIKQLYTIMQKRQLRGSSASMKLNDLSPILGGMLDSAICMPGVDTYGSKQNVYIKSVDSVVYVLPTKTKPKKLSFYGSNGRKYSYLFKGLEDLHLDERIMQFLSITNSMMARSSDKQFKALHYSVIPLGPQSGLISWVDGVVPLFSIYKKWQQRQISFKESSSNNTNTTSSTAANQDQSAANIGPTRPSELFYNKLLPLLAELNIKPSDPRKMWPLSVLRRVLKELSDETPRDLLAKELWCSALTAADWRKSVRNYTASVAVMSVIGYVIGLGDRHLDNVLIKAATGEIVHIDYNVCFEKGKTLRVPEKVPFRLTANLTEAMGLTGIEGGFRLGCEKVLKILRKERETLLTLLEAFVYDPLVDWTVNDDEKAIKTRLAMAGTSEFALNSLNPQSARLDPASNSETCNQKSINRKFDEIKKYWDVYNDDVRLQLGETCSTVHQLQQLHMRLNENEVRRRNISQQIAMIRELETLGPAIGSHRLNTLSMRFNTWQKDRDAVAVMRPEVEKTFAEVNQVVANFLDGLNEQSTQKLLAIDLELRKRLDRTEPTPLSVLRDETQMILRTLASDLYGQINRHIDSLRATEFCFDEAVMRCARIVHQYTEIMQYWPTARLCELKAIALQNEMADILANVNDNDAVAPQQNIHQCEDFLRGMEQLCTDLKCQMLDMETNMSQNNGELSVAGILEDLQRILEANIHNRALLQSLVAGILFQAYQDSWLVHDPAASTVYKDINFLRSMHKLIAESGCFEQVDVVCHGINLMWHPLVLVDEIKAVVEGHALKGLVRLFGTDDVQLQDELLDLCRDMSKETIRKITNGELIVLLEEIARVFDDFTLNMLKLFGYLRDKVSSDTNAVVTRYLWDHAGFAAYVERLKNRTLSQIFRQTYALVVAFNTNDATNIYDIRLVVEPMGEFIADIEKTILPGLTALICQGVLQEIALPVNLSAYDESTVRLADYLCKDLYLRLQMDATQMQLLQLLRGQKKYLQVAQHMASVYYWLNEKHLAGKYVLVEHIVDKAKLLEPLGDVMDQVALRLNEMTLLYNVYGKHLSETIDATQFPLLGEYMSSERKQMHDSIELANQVMVFARACREFETACEPNGPYTRLVSAWHKARGRLQKSSAAITDDEREIVQMLDPEGQVDHYWIANVNGLYEEMTVAVQRDLEALKADEKAAELHLQEHCKQLDALIAPFVRLDIRSLLKLILKNEKQRGQLADTGGIAKSARQLQATVKQFFASLSELQQTLNEGNFTAASLASVEQKIATSLELAQRNYATLGELMTQVNEAAIEWDPLDDDDSKAKSVAAGEKPASTVLVEQKRNAYAVSVWKRIRLKLEGRDPEAQHRSSISEQIDYIIQEATNLDNLAVLYEGWTPWV